MSWTIVQSATSAALGGGVTTTLPSTPTPGNLLIAILYAGHVGAYGTPPDGYTLQGQATHHVERELQVAARIAVEGSSASVSWSGLGGSARPVAVVLEVSGVDLPASDSEILAEQGSSSPYVMPAVAVPAGAFVLACFGDYTRTTPEFGPGAGLTEDYDVALATNLNSGTLFVGHRTDMTADAAFAASVTAVGSDWCGMVFVFGGAPTPVVPKITITINAVEFTGLLSKELRVELNGTGSVHFTISRGDAQATAANLARGNVIQVTIPEIHSDVLFEAFLEEGDFDLLSSDEEGGQELRFGGPGILAVLRRSVVSYEEYLDGTGNWKPNRGMVVFDAGVTEGHIVNKLIREARAATRPSDPIPMVTKTFDPLVDTNGTAWGDEVLEGKWKIPMGANLYDEIVRLVNAGLLSVEMAPGFDLNLYRTQGTDRTSATFAAGKVRFVAAVNIADGMARGMMGRDFATHAYIRYEDAWTNAAKLAGSFPYEQEIFFDAGRTDAANTAKRAARGEMGWRETTQEALLLSHIVPWPGDGPDDTLGLYLPGPTWSDNGRYWVGDLVTVHTGTGEFDYNNATHRIYAITLREDETGYLAPPILELNAPYLSADSASSGLSASPIAGTVPGSSGGTIKGDLSAYQQRAEKDQPDGYAGLDSSGLVPIAELGAHTDDTTDAHDASAISFDPTGLTSVTGTDVQTAIEELDAAIPAAGVLHNFAATTDPTTGDDSSAGYAIGSRWINTTTDEEFVCTDASVGAAVWASTTASSSGMTNPMTTAADLIVGDTGGTPARLAKGTDGQVLTVDPTTHLIVWANSASGFADPMTTRGDIIVRASGGTDRLALGASGHVLTSDGTDVGWAAAASGGGVAYPLDSPPGSAHASDDEFDDSSGMSGPVNGLDAKWTNPITSTRATDVAFSSLGYALIEPTAAGTSLISTRGPYGIRQASPTGSFTVSAKVILDPIATDVRTGIFVERLTATAKAHTIGPQASANRAVDVLGISTPSHSADWGGYDGYNQYIVLAGAGYAVWVRMVWDSSASTIAFYYSVNGYFWTLGWTRASQQQPEHLGLAMYANTGGIYAHQRFAVEWFRVTEP